MSLKKEIEKIFEENTNYNNPTQAVNQASSLNALSADLYTDSKRFVYELLQNADDSSVNNEDVKVWIKVFDSYLVVAHSGKPFSTRDLQGICNINNGTKKSDISKTGYKGIGFKSVFGQSEKVVIFSNKEYFRFDSSYPFEWNWDDSKAEWENKNDREFQFPWQIIPIYTEAEEIDKSINQFLEDIGATVATIIQMKNEKETCQAVKNLGQNLNMFLFLKNISVINFDITEPIYIEINRREMGRVTLKNGGALKSDWLINTVKLVVPDEVKEALQDERNIPEKLLTTESIELTLAAKVGNNGISKIFENETLLYSYLPTDERKYSLPVLVNTSFLTTANRESLHVDSKWNQWLFKMIAIEIFNWISRLVTTDYSFQAYQIIPKEIRNDDLGSQYNRGIQEAVNRIPFIITREKNLAKVKDTIVDFTHLSEKEFVGEKPIKYYVCREIEGEYSNSKQFVENTPFSHEFKKLGSLYFEWRHLPTFLKDICFVSGHTVDKNIELIKYLKKLSEVDKVKEISNEMIKNLPFILDHKNSLNYPTQICFPTADDQNWDNPNSDLSFLHRELQIWLQNNSDDRRWLENLGIQEKTDITYITQNILPNIESYVTSKNAIQTTCDLFSLYRKGDLREDLIKQLSRIKLKTKSGSLCPAEECYISDYYRPRLEMEELIKNDVFVCETYCVNIHEKEEWKRFLKMLGVQDGIKHLQYTKKVSTAELTTAGFKKEYFANKNFQPFQSIFPADVFSYLTTITYIQYTENNPKFAFKFWSDYIGNFSPDTINRLAIAFWGYDGMQGRTSGNSVENYVPWFVKNIKCIPTISGKCEITSSVFLNTEKIKDISGKYLNVFNGPELVPDWRAFFNFKTSLELKDYLELLSKISKDVDENGNVKNDNHKRIQLIYSILLVQCINWNTEEIEEVEKWASKNLVLNTQNQFSECTSIKYFIDGNEAIFQEQYNFIQLNAENKHSSNLETFLAYFKIQVLRQSEFDLIHTQEEACSVLMNKLKFILPYFKVWIENEDGDVDTIDNLKIIENKLKILNIFQAEELKITYRDIDFAKNVNVHFNETSLYVTDPWNSNSVLLKLSDVLCRYFQLIGHEKKLDFLLRSNGDEIKKYFVQEEINVSEEVLSIEFESDNIENLDTDNKTAIIDKKISEEFYHMSLQDSRRRDYIESLIPRAVSNVIKHLKKLPEYDCTNIETTAKSVISGITKNGNDITVVARPSDNEKVLIFYSSEFDVLEHVDAELWCENGITPPKQITMGQLLKKTGINRIPIKNIDFQDIELQTLLNKPKSEMLDFNAIPYSAHKMAKIISSFANSNGGTLIFGLKEASLTSNKIVGLSSDFNVTNITKRSIAMLEPTPTVTYDWISYRENSVFIIKIEKSDKDILLENQKYVREGINSILERKETITTKLSLSNYKKTVAIIIAIENYAPRDGNRIQKVKYASNDANIFKDMLRTSMEVDENDIYLYVDDSALKNNLEYNFKGLFHSLTEEDRLIFYYVGHGFHNGVTNYLSTYDMHPQYIAETAVSLRKILLDPLKESKCKNALIFIDACAQTFKDENGRRQINNIDDEEISMFINEFPYYATFLSCQPGQSSYSCDNLNNGIWTHHLVNAINGKVPQILSNNRYITDISLKEYLSNEVSKYAKEVLGFDQNPKAILDSSLENVVVEIKEKMKEN